MNQTAIDLLTRTVTRLPDWIRHDLAAKDSGVRLRAEETLIAMIVNVLGEGTNDAPHD
ncbi:hypothetical protein N5J77_24125 [Sphingobium yanoikuyae]|jgi:hypothetical protein|uniref:Uncharacterized protein n=1 Tax=Sphingobium yanoikuyae TaxID=13690 RepID=A0AA42WYM8_SPHYA|nr:MULTISPECIES: hypothetical protein [Sphingobium]MEA3540488.1 hypothetical protein [Pseudomonadota bacterium]HEV7436666.1 hypothetical protein [Pseudorhizobium sp.]MDH2134225.1 hypothetical protein [Sphingobium yanoikuyae]MDH2151415.1 hypothetical protein [Sphingobium yanoikuyae]MDH2169573.1 hypothetical protein [Sphingobium yanoikuyae]